MNAICDEDDIKAISFADSDKVSFFTIVFSSQLVALGGLLVRMKYDLAQKELKHWDDLGFVYDRLIEAATGIVCYGGNGGSCWKTWDEEQNAI